MSITSKVSSERSQPRARPAECSPSDAPFRIAVLADFSGRQSIAAASAPPTRLPARRLTSGRSRYSRRRDVQARCGTGACPSAASGIAVTLGFASLDDFHPDQVHERPSSRSPTRTTRRTRKQH